MTPEDMQVTMFYTKETSSIFKGPAPGADEIRKKIRIFFSALYLRAPEELDNKLGIWEYLNSEFYRFLNFFWSE